MGKRRIRLNSRREFYDCNGIPVTVDEATFTALAWDTNPARPFGLSTAMSDGAPISKDAFRALVAQMRAGG
jgi:hypothetical protein